MFFRQFISNLTGKMTTHNTKLVQNYFRSMKYFPKMQNFKVTLDNFFNYRHFIQSNNELLNKGGKQGEQISRRILTIIDHVST